MRPSKLRLPDSTETTARSCSSIASAIGSGRGPELPMHVVQPKPTTWKPRCSSGSTSPARLRYSVTTRDPGAREVLTHGLDLSPLSTAFLARRPAPSITDGLEVLVQLVIAAMTTEPSLRCTSSVLSSRSVGRGGFLPECGPGGRLLPPSFKKLPTGIGK